jgi:hypothetical protein
MREPVRSPLRLVIPGTAPQPAEPSLDVPSPVPPDGRRRPDSPARSGTSGTAGSSEARPPYLFLRHGTYYFKRKVPSDVRHGFPEFRSGQLVRSLGTSLLQQAKVLLAVEVTEFDLRVAQIRRETAQQQALVRAAEAREVYDNRRGSAVAQPAVPAKPQAGPGFSFSFQVPWGSGAAWPMASMPLVSAFPAAAPSRRHMQGTSARTVVRKAADRAPAAPAPATVAVAASPTEKLAQQAASRPQAEPKLLQPPASVGAGAVRIRRDSVAATTTMLHLYESWKLGT